MADALLVAARGGALCLSVRADIDDVCGQPLKASPLVQGKAQTQSGGDVCCRDCNDPPPI